MHASTGLRRSDRIAVVALSLFLVQKINDSWKLPGKNFLLWRPRVSARVIECTKKVKRTGRHVLVAASARRPDEANLVDFLNAKRRWALEMARFAVV